VTFSALAIPLLRSSLLASCRASSLALFLSARFVRFISLAAALTALVVFGSSSFFSGALLGFALCAPGSSRSSSRFVVFFGCATAHHGVICADDVGIVSRPRLMAIPSSRLAAALIWPDRAPSPALRFGARRLPQEPAKHATEAGFPCRRFRSLESSAAALTVVGWSIRIHHDYVIINSLLMGSVSHGSSLVLGPNR
jgi:hypothetical protein